MFPSFMFSQISIVLQFFFNTFFFSKFGCGTNEKFKEVFQDEEKSY